MEKIIIVSLIIMLSACYSTTHYVSVTREENYELYFLSDSEKPISGVRAECKFVEEGSSFDQTITTSYFNASTISDDNGRLIVNQRSHKTGGSYKHIGSYEWDHKHSKSSTAVCKFRLGDKLIYSSSMDKYIGQPKNIIYIKD